MAVSEVDISNVDRPPTPSKRSKVHAVASQIDSQPQARPMVPFFFPVVVPAMLLPRQVHEIRVLRGVRPPKRTCIYRKRVSRQRSDQQQR